MHISGIPTLTEHFPPRILFAKSIQIEQGSNTIILTATDDNGDTAQGTVYIDVYS